MPSWRLVQQEELGSLQAMTVIITGTQFRLVKGVGRAGTTRGSDSLRQKNEREKTNMSKGQGEKFLAAVKKLAGVKQLKGSPCGQIAARLEPPQKPDPEGLMEN